MVGLLSPTDGSDDVVQVVFVLVTMMRTVNLVDEAPAAAPVVARPAVVSALARCHGVVVPRVRSVTRDLPVLESQTHVVVLGSALSRHVVVLRGWRLQVDLGLWRLMSNVHRERGCEQRDR